MLLEMVEESYTLAPYLTLAFDLRKMKSFNPMNNPVAYYGGACDISNICSNQNPRWTQKPRIPLRFTHHIWF